MPKHPKLPRPEILDRFEPALARFRRDGWTPDRQRAFIDALAESGCVTEACKAVGMSTKSAYALRRTFEAQAFRLAWDEALQYAIRRLSDAVTSRAIHGVPVPHYYKGEQVGEHRRYNDRLAMFLLRYRDPMRFGRIIDKNEFSLHDEFFAVRLARASLAVERGSEELPMGIRPAAPEDEDDWLGGIEEEVEARRRKGPTHP